LAVAQSIILFGMGQSMALSVMTSSWVDCHFRLFSNSWKLIQSTSIDLSNFVSGEAMASSVTFWLRYCYLQNWWPTFSFKIVLSVMTTITVLLRSAKHN